MYRDSNLFDPKYSSNIIETADSHIDGILHYITYDSNTAESPYTGGVSGDYSAGYCLSQMNGDYGVVVAFPTGNSEMYIRSKSRGNWRNWIKMDGSMPSATIVRSGDLNDLKTPGIYYITEAIGNMPPAVNGWLIVYGSEPVNWGYKQVFYRAGTIGTNSYESWVRTYGISADAWSTWDMQLTNKGEWTLSGKAIGESNTEYTTSQFRNIKFATTAPSSLKNGEVCFVY